MILIDSKTEWSKAKDEQKIAYCESLFKDSKESLQKRHWEWYLNYTFLEGNHYVSYNSTTQSLETPPRRRGEVRIVINKILTGNRAVRNYATRQELKWEVSPGDEDKDSVDRARKKGKFLDWFYRNKHLETVIDGAIDSCLNTSIAWVEPYWDAKARTGNYKGDIKIKLHDSFHIYPDRHGFMDEGRFCGRFIAKAISRTLDEIRNDSRYNEKNRKLVKSDDELAASELKSRLIMKEQGTDKNGPIPRSMVKEFFLYNDEKNDKGGYITLFTYAGGQVLREEPLKERDFPLYACQVPLDPRRLYSRSRTADSIPLNKALNRNISQKIMYVNKALVLRLVAEKGHGASVVTNDMGDILEINAGRQFKQMEMHPLPNTLDSLTRELIAFQEDMQGAHEATVGANPSAARSGRQLEALQAADSNNLADINKSLKSFLPILGNRILELAGRHYSSTRLIQISEAEEQFKVVGAETPNKEITKDEDITVLDGNNDIVVGIGSWLGHTRDAQRETILQLAELGVLPAEEVLRQFEFPNVEELSRLAREQRVEQAAMKAATGGHGPGMEGGAGGTQNPDAQKFIDLADKENMSMMNGQMVPPTEGAPIEHTQAHLDFLFSQTAQQNPQAAQLIQEHVSGEPAYAELVQQYQQPQ